MKKANTVSKMKYDVWKLRLVPIPEAHLNIVRRILKDEKESVSELCAKVDAALMGLARRHGTIRHYPKGTWCEGQP